MKEGRGEGRRAEGEGEERKGGEEIGKEGLFRTKF